MREFLRAFAETNWQSTLQAEDKRNTWMAMLSASQMAQLTPGNILSDADVDGIRETIANSVRNPSRCCWASQLEVPLVQRHYEQHGISLQPVGAATTPADVLQHPLPMITLIYKCGAHYDSLELLDCSERVLPRANFEELLRNHVGSGPGASVSAAGTMPIALDFADAASAPANIDDTAAQRHNGDAAIIRDTQSMRATRAAGDVHHRGRSMCVARSARHTSGVQRPHSMPPAASGNAALRARHAESQSKVSAAPPDKPARCSAEAAAAAKAQSETRTRHGKSVGLAVKPLVGTAVYQLGGTGQNADITCKEIENNAFMAIVLVCLLIGIRIFEMIVDGDASLHKCLTVFGMDDKDSPRLLRCIQHICKGITKWMLAMKAHAGCAVVCVFGWRLHLTCMCDAYHYLVLHRAYRVPQVDSLVRAHAWYLLCNFALLEEQSSAHRLMHLQDKRRARRA